MSGYSSEVMMHKGILEEGMHLINKPFTPTVLVRAIRQTLDG
jgi:two-component system, cell cycle sensor histidine kinase and response regulator CckA